MQSSKGVPQQISASAELRQGRFAAKIEDGRVMLKKGGKPRMANG
jgi:hypothetical protein